MPLCVSCFDKLEIKRITPKGLEMWLCNKCNQKFVDLALSDRIKFIYKIHQNLQKGEG